MTIYQQMMLFECVRAAVSKYCLISHFTIVCFDFIICIVSSFFVECKLILCLWRCHFLTQRSYFTNQKFIITKISTFNCGS